MLSKSFIHGFTACTILLTALCSSCSDENPAEPEEENGARETSSFDVDVVNHTRIRLEGINGSIHMAGSTGATAVHIDGERRVTADNIADLDSYLDSVQVEVSDLTDSVLVKTVQPQDPGDLTYLVNYQITFPPQLEVIITNINGTVNVESTDNPVSVRNTNGDVVLGEISGDCMVAVVNGTIRGDVTIPPGGAINQSTVIGNLHLDIPQNTSAELSATAVGGSVSIVNLELEDEDSTSSVATGTLGDGQGTITLRTNVGNIIITGF
jgi:hypothetical protein